MLSISHEKLTLDNGLEVVLHEDHSLPFVAVNVWYHVGSKDEEPGRTGFAHLFEHVMFEGSKNHNRDYFEPLQKVGASINGSTTADRTTYWENVPSNYLELALWLEADRMGFLLDALDQKRFDVQRDVVKNERRQSYENRPYGAAQLLLQPALFPPSPSLQLAGHRFPGRPGRCPARRRQGVLPKILRPIQLQFSDRRRLRQGGGGAPREPIFRGYSSKPARQPGRPYGLAVKGRGAHDGP